MDRIRTTTRGIALLAALGALGLVAAAALAGVAVYKNNFSSKTEAKELRHAEGKHCDRTWRKKAESLRVDVERGPDLCGYRPPVQGDTAGPDLDFQAKEKILKVTPRRLRDGAYLMIEVRASKTTGYQLRVFPKKHKFQLTRLPAGGGSDFPAKGTSTAIAGVKKPNVLRLSALGDRVTAKANGKKLAQVNDSNSAEVSGRTLEVGIGGARSSQKQVSGTVDDLKVQVPKP
jgi:hypothetical protein